MAKVKVKLVDAPIAVMLSTVKIRAGLCEIEGLTFIDLDGELYETELGYKELIGQCKDAEDESTRQAL